MCVLVPQAILSNARCWVEHMQLNHSTGLDPEGVMLRASECAAQPFPNARFRLPQGCLATRLFLPVCAQKLLSCSHGERSSCASRVWALQDAGLHQFTRWAGTRCTASTGD